MQLLQCMLVSQKRAAEGELTSVLVKHEKPAHLALRVFINVYQAHALITTVAVCFLCICAGSAEKSAHRDKHHVCPLQRLLYGGLTFIGSSLHCEHYV